MKIQFDSFQGYQLEAIQSVVDLFEGQPLAKGTYEVSFGMESGSILYTDKGVGNNLVLTTDQLLKNLQSIQKKQEINISNKLVPAVSEDKKSTYTPLNFTIEMETGTGKTYTYIRTIYELNKTYGFKKFVIVVPSVAIREGALKNLQITTDHFQSLYHHIPIKYGVYESRNSNTLRSFATSNSLQVLVINIDSFAKDNNIINMIKEVGIKPIEYLQSTNPIVIVDEPQNMETDVRKTAIFNLNPLCTLRYSATHRNLYNLLYSLNPIDAYEMGLVKQIEVDGISSISDYNTPYINVLGFEQGRQNIKVILTIHVQTLFEVKEKKIKLSVGEDLFKISGGRSVYKDGYILNSIDIKANEVEFSNGLTLKLHDEVGKVSEDFIKYQIERTIHHHFQKEIRYWQPFEDHGNIKVLTLFFLDKVSNYREYDENGNPIKGKFAIWFEELFEKYVRENGIRSKYATLYSPPAPINYHNAERVHETDIPILHPEYLSASSVHNGYFSKDKKGSYKDTKGITKDDDDTYSLIMKDKERLLSMDEPLRFIFSHSALREGWDNPNIFQICTINESKSDIKKRQEIGRGLRLCVDNKGRRVLSKNINVLTVIANESYETFSEALQHEISEETNVNFTGRIKNAKDKAKVQLTKELTIKNYPYLFDFWQRIKSKVSYQVTYNTEELIVKVVELLKNPLLAPPIKRPLLEARTARIGISTTGIESTLQESQVKYASAVRYEFPDVYNYIQSRVDVSRKTIFEIIKNSGRSNEIEINPQMFLDIIVNSIKQVLTNLLVDGIKYEKINECYYEMSLFKLDEIETYLSNLFEVTKQEKTIFNYIQVDSEIESSFARDCEADKNIKFYFKLPRSFKIPTPIGNYTPDWAVVFENDRKVYFVAETKGTLNQQFLREIEQKKIECGAKYFSILKPLNLEYKLAVTTKDLY